MRKQCAEQGARSCEGDSPLVVIVKLPGELSEAQESFGTLSSSVHGEITAKRAAGQVQEKHWQQGQPHFCQSQRGKVCSAVMSIPTRAAHPSPGHPLCVSEAGQAAAIPQLLGCSGWEAKITTEAIGSREMTCSGV